ncbi:hypothetical protein E2320_003478, partial [Naja naja]
MVPYFRRFLDPRYDQMDGLGFNQKGQFNLSRSSTCPPPHFAMTYPPPVKKIHVNDSGLPPRSLVLGSLQRDGCALPFVGRPLVGGTHFAPANKMCFANRIHTGITSFLILFMVLSLPILQTFPVVLNLGSGDVPSLPHFLSFPFNRPFSFTLTCLNMLDFLLCERGIPFPRFQPGNYTTDRLVFINVLLSLALELEQ